LTRHVSATPDVCTNDPDPAGMPKRCQRRFFTTNPLTEVPTNYVRRTNIIARGQRHRPTKKLAFLAVGNAVKEEG